MSYAKVLHQPKEIKKLGINNMLPVAHNIEIVNYVLPDHQQGTDFQRRSELGQFMTPSQIAHFMASLFDRSYAGTSDRVVLVRRAFGHAVRHRRHDHHGKHPRFLVSGR